MNLINTKIYLCFLGREFNNYILTEADGDVLANFLLTNGNIYMEGGLTWAKDPQTQVHTNLISMQNSLAGH